MIESGGGGEVISRGSFCLSTAHQSKYEKGKNDVMKIKK